MERITQCISTLDKSLTDLIQVTSLSPLLQPPLLSLTEHESTSITQIGARPDEAVSWGKIKIDGESVKVYADATLVFPLVVAATFGKAHWDKQKSQEQSVEEKGKEAV
jgi:hypothetical protein